MAKAKRRRKQRTVDRRPIFVFLLRNTELGARDSTLWSRGHDAVSRRVADMGGKCVFFLTTGGVYDSVSVISGISSADAIQLASEIDRWGTVRATLLSGVKIMK